MVGALVVTECLSIVVAGGPPKRIPLGAAV
jgi:hypothetical protein